MLRVGNPIERLDVTPDLDSEYSSRDFRFLEQITGLKVNWNVGKFYSPTDKKEYICGSSTADSLYFEAVVESSSWIEGLQLVTEA
ncbi:hypothetical protein GALMADRAFT_255902 [Galerina marginata CBS 339.88]|uniref:Uncharacterized protein n=1 Tax=Galerina marginata (strain CBS 339.88) TaxID=685588 RepID=A0A067SHE6_GALM3|nr:hypothetical protein GALMADRAFT_255902 [Galerina marginata CBS 339.88]